jgi:dTDP-4-amino-4,6-dideoxygalactose transaminase
MTAFATVLAIVRAGATPVLADVDSATAMLCPQSVMRCLTPRTKAILLVHLYGQIGPVEELLEISAAHGVDLIEDCAQAHGAQHNGKSAGSFGAFAAWSFYPTKNLGAVGDAGALTTSARELAERGRVLRNYGQTVRYEHALYGMNSRLDELQAAILRERLPYLHAWVARRRQIAAAYLTGIQNRSVQLMRAPTDPLRHSYHLFVVRTPRRSELQAHLRAHQVESLIHYPIPVHFQAPCRGLERDPSGLRRAEEHAESCLSLPCHPGMSDEAVARVIAAVNIFGE